MIGASCSDSCTQKLPLRQVTPIQQREHYDGSSRAAHLDMDCRLFPATRPALAPRRRNIRRYPLGQHLTATMSGKFDSPGTGNDSAMINRNVLDQFTVFCADPHSIFKYLA
jgi:hypothetical protein